MPEKYITYAGPPVHGIWEVGQSTTDVNGDEWLCTQRGVAGQPGTSFLQTSTPPSGGGEVLKIIAGTGIGVSPTSGAGNVTITNTQTQGIESIVAGTGIAVNVTDPLNPVVSASVSPAASSASVAITAGAAVHNGLGYDAVIGCYLNVTAASVGTISVGVGSASSPAAQKIVTGWTSVDTNIVPISAYVPSGYYFIVNTTGITARILGQWYPV